MSGYSAFARYYDELTANIDYKKRGEYFHSIIQRFKTTKENILLDLACGTGSISEVMAGLGYDVIGVDNSDEMLGIALDKKFDSGLDIQYLCQDMTELDMYGTIGAAVCALDSLNHLESADDLRAVFERVALFCDKDAVFLFDVNTVYKHEKVLADNTFVYETDDVFCVWENEYLGNGVTDIQLDFFERDGDIYRRSSDGFTETAYPRELTEQMLTDAGFEICGVFEYPTGNEPTENSEKLTFAAKMTVPKNKYF